MKNTPIHLQLRNRKDIATKGDANGEITTYFLPPDELARYRSLKPPTDSNGKKLRRPTNGGGVA